MASRSFKEQARKLSRLLGCAAAAGRCHASVKEALFCMAFEGPTKQFAHLEGVKRMRDQCSHVSKKQMALLSKGRSKAVSRHHKQHNSTSARVPATAAPQQTGQHHERNDKKVKEHESLIMVKESKHQSAPSFVQVAEIKRAVMRALTQL